MPFQEDPDIWLSDRDIRRINQRMAAEMDEKISNSPFVYPYKTYQYQEGDVYDVVARDILAKAIDITATTDRPKDDATRIRKEVLDLLFSAWATTDPKEMQVSLTRLQRLTLFPWAGLWKDGDELRWGTPEQMAELADHLHMGRAYELAKKKYSKEWIRSSVFHVLPDLDGVRTDDAMERARSARGYLIKGCAQHLEVRRTYYDGERLEKLLEAAERIKQVTYAPWWLLMRGKDDRYPDYRAFQLFDICGMATFDKNVVVAEKTGSGWAAEGVCHICGSSFSDHDTTMLPDPRRCLYEPCQRMVMVVDHE